MKIVESFEKELQQIDIWQKKEPHIDLLYINYNQIMDQKESEIARINEFLGEWLDTDAMLKVIDDNLYRNRK